jgi:hypothetical protein
VVEPAPRLPFGAWAQTVESILPEGPLRDPGGDVSYVTAYVETRQGPENDRINLRWPGPVSGKVVLRLRIDDAV